MEIAGKVAVVTGGATGIGRATALALAEAGAAAVCIADVDEAGGAGTATDVEARGARAMFRRTDVTDADDLRALFEAATSELGPIDIVHNNAGIVSGDPAWPDTSIERIEHVTRVNLLGIAFGTRLAVDRMAGRGGVVINTASVAGLGDPMPTDPMYAATKTAAVVFTKSCAPLKDSHGVRVNCVLPGITDTPIINKTGDGTRPAAWLEPVLSMIPMLQPEEIADAVLALVRDDSAAGEAVVIQNRMPAATDAGA